MKINYDKLVIFYLIFYSLIQIPLLDIPSILSDDGTHMILSLFYKDLITTVLKTKSFSFSKAYAFSLSYLIHYPKLQVFYPPLYHLTTGLIFYSILGVSSFTARFVSFLFGIFSIVIFYIFSKKLLEPQMGFISTILFSLNPIILRFIRLAYKDSTVIFFSLLAMYLYFITLKNKKSFYYIILGFICSLTILADMPGVIVPFSIFFMLLFKREKLKNIILFLIPLFLILMPYLILIVKAGGIEVNTIRYQLYAGFNTFSLNIFLVTLPLTILIILSFYKYICDKKIFWKELLIWTIISFIIIFFMAFNERFAVFFKLPAYLISAYWIGKRKSFLFIMLVLSVVISIYLIKDDFLVRYPVKDAMNFVYNNLPKGSNVALINERGNLYSSSFMFSLIVNDENKNIIFLRPCYFTNKTINEKLNILKENGVYFVIAIKNTPGYEIITEIKDRIEKIYEKDVIEVYEFKDYTQTNKLCNYICTTEEVYCTKYNSPFDVYS